MLQLSFSGVRADLEVEAVRRKRLLHLPQKSISKRHDVLEPHQKF